MIQIRILAAHPRQLRISQPRINRELDHDHVSRVARVPNGFVKTDQFMIGEQFREPLLHLRLADALCCPRCLPFLTVPPCWCAQSTSCFQVTKLGRVFAARLDVNLFVKDRVVIPAGSKVYGRVKSSRSEGRTFGQSKLALSLRKIVVDGRPVAISTRVRGIRSPQWAEHCR